METRHTAEVWVRFQQAQQQGTVIQMALGCRGRSGNEESSGHRDGIPQGSEGCLLNAMLLASASLLESLDNLWFAVAPIFCLCMALPVLTLHVSFINQIQASLINVVT